MSRSGRNTVTMEMEQLMLYTRYLELQGNRVIEILEMKETEERHRRHRLQLTAVSPF